MQAINSTIEAVKQEARSLPLSIAIPTYNRCDSVVSLVNTLIPQLEPDDELLVLDDGSQDATVKTLQAIPQVKVLSNSTNLGMVKNWNACLLAAACEWICVIHDDDRVTPEALKTIRRACAVAGAPALIVHQSLGTELDNHFRYRWLEAGPWSILNASTNPSGVTLHRSMVDQIGLFDPQFTYSCDLEYFARICARYSCLVIESPEVLHYNQHDQNYQYKTWRQPTFWQQLEQIEHTVIRYANLSGAVANQRFRDRMSEYAAHMLRHANRAEDATLLRHVGSVLVKQSYLGRKIRLSASIAAVANVYIEF